MIVKRGPNLDGAPKVRTCRTCDYEFPPGISLQVICDECTAFVLTFAESYRDGDYLDTLSKRTEERERTEARERG